MHLDLPQVTEILRLCVSYLSVEYVSCMTAMTHWCVSRVDRWGPLAVHAVAAAGLQGRILRCRWRIDVRTRNVQRVLQPAAPLDSQHTGQHDGSDVWLPPYGDGQWQYIVPVHDVSGGRHGSQYACSCDCGTDGRWSYSRRCWRWTVLVVVSNVHWRRRLLHARLLQVYRRTQSIS